MGTHVGNDSLRKGTRLISTWSGHFLWSEGSMADGLTFFLSGPSLSGCKTARRLPKLAKLHWMSLTARWQHRTRRLMEMPMRIRESARSALNLLVVIIKESARRH